MLARLKRITRKLTSFIHVLKGTASVSYSQFGEDIIILKMLQRYNLTDISYLDIGANDPVMGSNTYNFYLRGGRGVLIEPNPMRYQMIKATRPQDICLNVGISDGSATDGEYFMFAKEYDGMNTFSSEEAKRYEQEGFKIQERRMVPLLDVNEVLAKHFAKPPTLISIDVEGLDELILHRLDFSKYAPMLICVESVYFSKATEYTKREPLISYILSKGYFIYADTHINTIFCNKAQFDQINKQNR